MVKVGFNNFKAFGENLQKFSDKPITLVYGPNSSGKSSFLHAMLYREYLLGGGDINLKKSNFAGDELDLGGLDNFIHKHDTDRVITYTYDFADQESIRYLLYSKCLEHFKVRYEKGSKNLDPKYLFRIICEKGGLERFMREHKDISIDTNLDIDELRGIVENNYGIEKIEIKVRSGLDQDFFKQDIFILINSKEYARIRPFYNRNTPLDDFAIFKNMNMAFSIDFFMMKFDKEHPFIKTVKDIADYNENDEDVSETIIDDKGIVLGKSDEGMYAWCGEQIKHKNIHDILTEFDKSKGIGALLGNVALCIFQGLNNYRYKEAIQYFSPLRFYPERKDLVFDKFSDTVSYDKVHSSKEIWQKILLDKDSREKLNVWLSDDKKLKSTYKIEVEKFYKVDDPKNVKELVEPDIQELKFLDLRTGVFVSPRDMGLGISQSLPILASCMALDNSSIFIEQPELHLHPAVQCEMADEFIRSKNNNKNNFFIETHSEHILLRIMRRLRYSSEGKINKNDELYITPDDICLLYVDNNGKKTYIKELGLDEDGVLLDAWPNGFFEEGYKERFE